MKEYRSSLEANYRGMRPLAVGSMWFCSLNDDITLSDEATTRPLIFRVWLLLQQQHGTSRMTESGGEEGKKICPDAFSLTLSRHHPSSQINCTQCRLAVEANKGNKNKTRGRFFLSLFQLQLFSVKKNSSQARAKARAKFRCLVNRFVADCMRSRLKAFQIRIKRTEQMECFTYSLVSGT